MAERERQLPPTVSFVLGFFAVAWVLIRVAAVITAALAIFLIAYLGYFTLPFLFLLGAFALLGTSSFFRQLARLRSRLRTRRR